MDRERETQAFIRPWIEREPALWLAAQFAGDARARAQFLALQVLIRELLEASVAVGDERVTAAKLGWWQDEALLWQQGHGRHPLLQDVDGPVWGSALLQLLPALAAWVQAPPPATLDQAWASLRPMAAVLAGWPGAGNAQTEVWQGLGFAIALRLSTQARAPLATVIPMDVWARHGVRRSAVEGLTDAQRDALLADCARRVPPWPNGRRQPALSALVALEQRWLRLASSGRVRGRLGPTAAWTAWRAARRALKG